MTLPPGFWILAAGEGLLTAGYAISFPFLAVYLSAHRGVLMSWVGFFLACSMLIVSLAQYIGGEFSDAFGRRKVMVYALALRTLQIAVIAWLIYSSAPVWAIFVFHPLGLFIGSFFHPAARSWVADYTHPAGRMKAYGLLRMGSNAGWALGPALGGLLAAGSIFASVRFTVEKSFAARPYHPAAFAIAASTAFLWIGGRKVVERVFMMVSTP